MTPSETYIYRNTLDTIIVLFYMAENYFLNKVFERLWLERRGGEASVDSNLAYFIIKVDKLNTPK